MRTWVKIVIPTVLLTIGVVICAFRWQAWFGMPEEPRWTGDTLNYEFSTFGRDSVPGFVFCDSAWQDTLSPESLDILVLGDIHNRLTKADYDSLALREPNVDITAQVGDWMDRGYFYYHQLLLREFSETGLKDKPVINCPGNHEYTKGLHKRLSEEWQVCFPQPESSLAVPGVFYYVDFPQLRFIVLDTNPLERLVYLTRTVTWLQDAINHADGRYTVVMMHHPVYSAGKGRSNPLIYTAFRHILGQADLVLAGHDHSYMRRMPFVVLNSGGHLKIPRNSAKSECVSENPVYGVISIKPDCSALAFKVHRLSDGSCIDSVYVKH